MRLGLRNEGISKLVFDRDVNVFESKYKFLLTENSSLNFAMCVIESNQFYEFYNALKCWVQ